MTGMKYSKNFIPEHSSKFQSNESFFDPPNIIVGLLEKKTWEFPWIIMPMNFSRFTLCDVNQWLNLAEQRRVNLAERYRPYHNQRLKSVH